MEENVVIDEKKKPLEIYGITIWKIMAYFIIYSIMGYIIETLFGIITKGRWESRQSFLYGPFCGIYGLGAVLMILSLQRFKKKNYTLFVAGFVIGSIIEYIISLIGEYIFNIKWWDYSEKPFNINGRICIVFSIFWGLLAVYLMEDINPRVDKLISFIQEKISLKPIRTIILLIMIFLLFDMIITGYALQMFTIRIVHDNNLSVNNKNMIDKQYEEIYANDLEQAKFIYEHFGNEKMIKTFPNIKIQDVNGNILYYESYVGDIEPYYYDFREEKEILNEIVAEVINFSEAIVN